MQIDHEEYLRRILKSKEFALEELNIQHRVAIAVHGEKKDLLQREIYSIEDQLRDHTKEEGK